MHNKPHDNSLHAVYMWDEITYIAPNFNGWNFTTHLTGFVIIYPCRDYKSVLVKGAPGDTDPGSGQHIIRSNIVMTVYQIWSLYT